MSKKTVYETTAPAPTWRSAGNEFRHRGLLGNRLMLVAAEATIRLACDDDTVLPTLEAEARAALAEARDTFMASDATWLECKAVQDRLAECRQDVSTMEGVIAALDQQTMEAIRAGEAHDDLITQVTEKKTALEATRRVVTQLEVELPGLRHRAEAALRSVLKYRRVELQTVEAQEADSTRMQLAEQIQELVEKLRGNAVRQHLFRDNDFASDLTELPRLPKPVSKPRAAAVEAPAGSGFQRGRNYAETVTA